MLPESSPVLGLLRAQRSVCLLTSPQPARTLLFWLQHVLSTPSHGSSSSRRQGEDEEGGGRALLHLVTLGWWGSVSTVQVLSAAVSGLHMSVNVVDGLAAMEPLPDDEKCEVVVVVDLDAFPAAQAVPSAPDWLPARLLQAQAALGFSRLLVNSACAREALLSWPGMPPPLVEEGRALVGAGLCEPQEDAERLSFMVDQQSAFWLLEAEDLKRLHHEPPLLTGNSSSSSSTVDQRWRASRQACLAKQQRQDEERRAILARRMSNRAEAPPPSSPPPPPYVLLVCCLDTGETEADRLQLSLLRSLLASLLASLLLTTASSLTVHVIVNPAAESPVQQVAQWAARLDDALGHRRGARLTPIVEAVPVHPALQGSTWPCALLRLDMVALLPPQVDSILYLDTDMVLLEDVGALWAQLAMLQEGHLAGVVAEHGCCSRDAYYQSGRQQFEFWGPTGLNSGLLLVNLTRLRDKQEWLLSRLNVTSLSRPAFPDQDLLNAMLHDQATALDCHWNYRPDFCLFSTYDCQRCPHAPAVLHGSRRAFAPPGSDSRVEVFAAAREAVMELAGEIQDASMAEDATAAMASLASRWDERLIGPLTRRQEGGWQPCASLEPALRESIRRMLRPLAVA